MTWLALLSCTSSPRAVGELGDWPFLYPLDSPAKISLRDGGEVPTSAEGCGTCHVEHFAEWQQTTHARALTDLQYVAELSKPDQPRWLCLNCHVPTRPQRAWRITPETSLDQLQGEPEPTYDPARAQEGVTCATCHVRRGPDGAALVVGPRGSGRAPHAVREDPQALHQVCERCHSPGPARLGPTFVCWFESREELEAGPSAGASCPSCHMPTTSRPAASGGPAVELRRHVWVGGGVPKTYAGYGTLLDRGFEPGFDVRLESRGVILTNRSGHALPTGDPERYLRVSLRLVGSDGALLGEEVHGLGQRWDWGDVATQRDAHRLEDTRLRPGETRRIESGLGLGLDTRLVLEIAHVRLAPENVGHMASARLDAEVRALWPEAEGMLAEFDRHYPLGTIVFRETLYPDGSSMREALPVLLEESRGLGERGMAEKAARFASPGRGL
jgi:hypothetical protein